MTKEEIRMSIRSHKRSLTSNQIKTSGFDLVRQMKQFTPYKEADQIYLFASYNQEIATYGLMEHAMRDGKRVALPRVEGKEIDFYYISSLTDLAPGYQGIPEPIGNDRAAPSIKKQALMLLPGLAFSLKGERLGYGGGFYDKYLSKQPDGAFTTCAIGYSFQVLSTVPVEEHDKRVDYVVTPDGVYRCNGTAERLPNIGQFQILH